MNRKPKQPTPLRELMEKWKRPELDRREGSVPRASHSEATIPASQLTKGRKLFRFREAFENKRSLGEGRTTK